MSTETQPERVRAIRKSDGTFRNPWPAFVERGLLHVMKWKWSSSAPKFPKPHEVHELFAPKGLLTADDHVFLRRHHGICPRKSSSAHRTPQESSWASEWFHNAALREDRKGQISVTWIGHSTFLVQCGGINMLTDPVFSTHAAPMKLPGTPKRMVNVPVTVEDLPRIDVVTISHNHYDHLDTQSVQELVREHNPIFVVPLNMKRWFQGTIQLLDESRVVELDWWEEATLQLCPTTGRLIVVEAPSEMSTELVHNLPRQPTPEAPSLVRVSAVPAQHWSMRTGFDRYHELWCGFVARFSLLTSQNDATSIVTRSVFHAGDTGYTAAYKDVGKVYQSTGSCTQPLADVNPSATPFGVDIGLIPIGAYEPRWMMSPQHVDPIEALQIHDDIGAKFSIGMHWGTFILTDEPVDEPPKLLAKALDDANKTVSSGRGHERRPGEFVAWRHGELRNFTSEMLDTLNRETK